MKEVSVLILRRAVSLSSNAGEARGRVRAGQGWGRGRGNHDQGRGRGRGRGRDSRIQEHTRDRAQSTRRPAAQIKRIPNSLEGQD
jgi:hypothetical protein